MKPVLGVIEGEHNLEIKVTTHEKVMPHDRFLLQITTLSRAEAAGMDSIKWKELETSRLKEIFINCYAPGFADENFQATTPSSSYETSSMTVKRGISSVKRKQKVHFAAEQRQFSLNEIIFVGIFCLLLGIYIG